MRSKSIISLLVITLLSVFSISEEVPQEVYDLAESIKPLGMDATVVAAVKAQNAEGLSLDVIKSRDTTWRTVSGLDSFMESLLSSAVAKRLADFESSEPFYVELFLMDNQGANVAMTSKTSDYWQGDEAKWQKSFAGGAGAIHFGDVEFDESAQAYLVQVSIPVMDGGKAIGAITIGVNLDELGV